MWLNEKNDVQCQYLRTLNEFRKQFIITGKQLKLKKDNELKKAKREQFKESQRQKRMSGKGKKIGLPLKKFNISVDDIKENVSNASSGLPPPPVCRTVRGSSDQLLASLLMQDSSQLLNKLKERRQRTAQLK